MKLGRNDPGPCGSGLKVKRCCGIDAIHRRARLAEETAEELFTLAVHFPRSRPTSASFDAWAATAPDEPSQQALDAGVEAIGEVECGRIVGSFAEEHPEAWAGVLADFGNDELAVEIVLAGAVVAGLLERRPPAPSSLALLDRFDAPSAGHAVAYVLDPGDLWSVVESGETAAALDRALSGELSDDEHESLWERVLEQELDGLLTAWHEQRLDILLCRLRDHLPVPQYPRASGLLLDGLRDADARRTIAKELLAVSLDRVYDTEEPLAA
jgi:hypothetical protein